MAAAAAAAEVVYKETEEAEWREEKMLDGKSPTTFPQVGGLFIYFFFCHLRRRPILSAVIIKSFVCARAVNSTYIYMYTLKRLLYCSAQPIRAAWR